MHTVESEQNIDSYGEGISVFVDDTQHIGKLLRHFEQDRAQGLEPFAFAGPCQDGQQSVRVLRFEEPCTVRPDKMASLEKVGRHTLVVEVGEHLCWAEPLVVIPKPGEEGASILERSEKKGREANG